MSTQRLATVECNAQTLADVLGTAALDGPDSEPHEEMFVRVTDEAITTPASAAETSQASFCTIESGVFDRLSASEPVEALFPIRAVLDWLAWFDGEDLTLDFEGEPGAAVAAALRLRGTDREVAVDCVAEPAVLEEIRLWLPDRFDGTVFLDGDGEPAPTRVETTTAALNRVVDAVDHCDGAGSYPLVVTDGQLRFAVDGERAHASGRLTAAVDGPAFDYRYGPGFARVVRTLSGPVSLAVTPAGQLAIIREQEAATFRYVLQPVGEE